MDTSTVAPHAGISGEPERGDGSLHSYEIVFAGGTRRAYADTETALIAALIDGYPNLSETEQWEARLLYAIRAQVIAQAELNADDAFATLTLPERTVLQAPRHQPPVVRTWASRIPLILVTTFYEPAGPNPRPVREQGMEPNVIWIDPSDDHSFLMSLHDVGVIALHTSH